MKSANAEPGRVNSWDIWRISQGTLAWCQFFYDESTARNKTIVTPGSYSHFLPDRESSQGSILPDSEIRDYCFMFCLSLTSFQGSEARYDVACTRVPSLFQVVPSNGVLPSSGHMGLWPQSFRS